MIVVSAMKRAGALLADSKKWAAADGAHPFAAREL
jgi:hypothetical protein